MQILVVDIENKENTVLLSMNIYSEGVFSTG